MLGTIIEKLSSLLSKGSFISSFFPLLAVTAANVGLLVMVHEPFREWLSVNSTNPEFLSGAIIAFMIASLLFAVINTRLRELMEGNFWPKKICGIFTKSQQQRLKRLNAEYSTLQRSRRFWDKESPRWKEILSSARRQQPKQVNRTYHSNRWAGSMILRLQKRRIHGEIIPTAEIKFAVMALKRELRFTPMVSALDNDHVELAENLIPYARAKTRQEIIRVFNERQFNFPDEILAPTSMGNIGLSVRSYAQSRYQMNLERFWTRLQKVMQNEPFYSVLQDSKVQLDFLVSMFWLCAISVGFWLVALVLIGYSLWLFFVIAIAGPVVLWSLYRLGLQNYRAFTDLMRSAVDMYRLRLLKELQIPEPTGTKHEAALWQALADRMDYGKDFNISYREEQ